MQDSGRTVVDRDGVVVATVDATAAAPEVVAFLNRVEAVVGIPVVDEAERVRLEAVVSDGATRPDGWRQLVASERGRVVGYAGLLLPGDRTDDAVGDVAVDPAVPAPAAVLAGLLEAVRTVIGREAVASAHLQLWLRRAGEHDLEVAASAGFGVERRLAVLGRNLREGDGAGPSTLPTGTTLRHYLEDEDDEGVVGVLAAAYAGTPEAGWDLDTFRARRALPWFRPEDLLVAEDAAGTIVGLHWLKRRSAQVGEVYNLALAPQAQGGGLAQALLTAGLAHLAEVGCREALLWVDRANPRAVGLYESNGFVLRWEDVALRQRP